MAYGDAAASLVGERYGKRKYKLIASKSLEGSAAMFFVSFSSLLIGLVLFSGIYSFAVFEWIAGVLLATIVATLVEGLSPLGFDNLTVPMASALTFLALNGGI
jgi:phytol kinase